MKYKGHMIIVDSRYALEIWKYLNLVWPGETACTYEANFELIFQQFGNIENQRVAW